MAVMQPGLIAIILLLAPLLYGGNRPLPLMALELLALPLLFFAGRARQSLGNLAWPLITLLALAALLPLLQLIPVPWAVWSALPSLQPYAQALQLAFNGAGANVPQAMPLSLMPPLTEYALLAFLPPLLVFLGSVGTEQGMLRKLTTGLLIVAGLQACIGLSQYVSGDRPTGTYANPDHLAGLLEMTLPVALALLVAHVGHQMRPDRPSRNWRKRLMNWVSMYTSSVALYGLLALVILLGLIFTKSRSGVLLAMLVILLCAIAFARKLGGNNVFGAVGSFVTIAIGIAAAAGLVPVLERFARVDHLQDARWPIFAAMADVIPAYLPFGSGIGTFREIFERFQPFDLYGTTVNHAHNDYFEWLMEGGFPAAVILICLLVTFLWRWPQLITRGQWRTMHMVQVGAGIGMTAMLFHSLVDFNLRIPANQIVFAFLAALFFSRQGDAAVVHPERKLESPPQPSSEPMPEASLAPAANEKSRVEPSLRTEPVPEASPVRGPNPFDE